MIQLQFKTSLANPYKSQSQKSRVLTETWVHEEIFCTSCGANINKFQNNNPAADFYCPVCDEIYELKSKRDPLGVKLVNGAYSTLINRLNGNNNPNLFVLNYDNLKFRVVNFFVVPKHFFIPAIIEKRPPLAPTSRRAGWIGCNILIRDIPESGKIYYVKDGVVLNKGQILDTWKKTFFIRESSSLAEQNWIIDIIKGIDAISTVDFNLADMYELESFLSLKHPNNKHIKEKIRQQLQILRNNGFIEFLGQGRYRKT